MTSLATEPYVLSDDALDLIFRKARTANAFTDEPVSIEQVRSIFELAKYGPTSMNNQPLRLVVLESREARERLLPHLAAGNRDKTSSAPLTVILAADTHFHERLDEHFPHAPGVRQMFDDNASMREQQAEFNAALQIGYFIVGIRAAGLAVGPMGGFDAAGVDAEFLTDTSWTSLVVANIGHPGPDAWSDRLPRMTFEDAVTVL